MACPFNNAVTADDGVMKYDTYLQVEKLLSCQTLESEKRGERSHDEHLFIIMHQVVELWFKQLVVEIIAIQEQLDNKQSGFDDSVLFVVINRQGRIIKIQKLLIEQFGVIETMTPLDFMDFRGLLSPASGFQSWQFRILEHKLGVKDENRVNEAGYMQEICNPCHLDEIKAEKEKRSLFDSLQTWLERTPLDRWEDYVKAVGRWMNDQEVSAKAERDDEKRQAGLNSVRLQKEAFDIVLKPDEYEKLFSFDEHGKLIKDGDVLTVAKEQKPRYHLSYRAFQGALLITVFRDDKRFQQPFQMLTAFTEIDTLMLKWRFHHVQMVHRMIGSKTGTGGSAGYDYLRKTVVSEKYSTFSDLCKLATFLLPPKYVR